MKTSLKTTVGGLLSALGAAIVGANAAIEVVAPPWLLFAGYVMASIGPVLLGASARGANRSSQGHGVRP